jgi:hypothetical protein
MDEETRHDRGSAGAQRWVLAGVSALASAVLVLYLAIAAFDVLLLLLLCGTIVLLERTVGDWLADALGPTAGIVLFVGVVAALLWGLLGTHQGRAARETVLRVGTERGLSTVFVSPYSTPWLLDRPSSSPPTAAPGARSSSSSGDLAPAAASRRVSSPAASSAGRGSESAPSRTGQPLGTAGASPGAQTGGGPAVSPGVQAGSGSSGSGASPDLAAPVKPGDSVRPAAPSPTQLTVRAIPTDQASVMVLQAEVTSGPHHVTAGHVEFSLNGRMVARVPLTSDGLAEARMGNLARGLYRVTARFVPSEEFRESRAETEFRV